MILDDECAKDFDFQALNRTDFNVLNRPVADLVASHNKMALAVRGTVLSAPEQVLH